MFHEHTSVSFVRCPFIPTTDGDERRMEDDEGWVMPPRQRTKKHSSVAAVLFWTAVVLVVTPFIAPRAYAQEKAGDSPSSSTESHTSTRSSPHRATERSNQTTEEWLSVGGEIRLRWEGRRHAGFRSGNDDGYLLTRFRFHLDVHPGEWFRAYIEGQDAQALGLAGGPDPPVFQDTFDLRQAYIDLFHRQKRGLGLRLGRQELIFGEERLIGAFNWGNTARTFDAVRVYYETKAIRLDAFAASVVRIQDERFNRTAKGDNLYGVYTAFPRLIPRGRWEVYTLWRAQSQTVNERGERGDADRVTFGTRLVGKLPHNFDYGVELVGQAGDVAGDRVRAWAAHLQLGYTPARVRLKPRFLAEYNFASGDDDPNDGKVGTFDQLFPTNHNKYGIADLVGWRNMHNLRLGLSLKPTDRTGIHFDVHSFWLASRRDALYNAPGRPVARIPEGATSRHIGEEIDLYGSIKLTTSLSLGAGVAHLFAGQFLQQATPGENTMFAYAMASYHF